MKILFFCCLCFCSEFTFGQTEISFEQFLKLDDAIDTTANVSLADFNGDSHLDILLVKGRHWPIAEKIILCDGKGGILKKYNLSNIKDRSYSGIVADFNGDNFIDIAISNDAPDKKIIYFNDGKGNFEVGCEFGNSDWSTRNLSIADINGDKLPDLIFANRGAKGRTKNYFCLNNGNGHFSSSYIGFAPYPCTSIYAVDFNKDGYIDLVVPNRDGGQSYIYLGNAQLNYSDANRLLFGSSDATIRMTAVDDFNGDGLLDIVACDEKAGVNIYLGQKNNAFSGGISLLDRKKIPHAITVADLNKDNKMDIVVGYASAPSNVFINDGTALNFQSHSFGDSLGTVYGIAIGDLNSDGISDIVVARSEAPSMVYFGKIDAK